MQMKDPIALSYGDSLAAWITTGADWEATKVVSTSEKDGEDEESERADVPELRNYFNSFQI